MDPYEVHLFKFAVLNQKGTIAPPAYKRKRAAATPPPPQVPESLSINQCVSQIHVS